MKLIAVALAGLLVLAIVEGVAIYQLQRAVIDHRAVIESLRAHPLQSCFSIPIGALKNFTSPAWRILIAYDSNSSLSYPLVCPR